MSNRAQLTDLNTIADFVAAGNATFTLESEKTGTHFTYRVNTKENDDGSTVTFIALLTGPDNESDYNYMGLLTERGPMRTRNSRVGEDAPSWRALTWFFRRLSDPTLGLAGLRFWHEGKCGRCGRKLTVPESIATGLGPVCAGA